jgi:hypothetical protein
MEIELSSVLRALHILTAALWIGAGAMLTLFIMPSIRRTGAAGGSVIAESMRRGLGTFMASVAGLAFLSGLSLYWLRFQMLGANAMHGISATLLAIGALAGVIAMIIGGAILGRTSRQLAQLASAATEEATTARIAALHRRAAAASKVALTLLVIALLLMVISRSF